MPSRVLASPRDHRRDPSLPSRCSSRGSSLLRSPRTPAAPRALSPSAYTRRAAPTRAAQTGLSCSVPLRARVLRPLPRRDLPHVHLRTEASQTWPSPRHDRLGSRVVNLSRLQASRDVAARVLAPSVEAFDTPLGPPGSLPMPGVCYSALRRLPRRDLHPLETNSVKQTISVRFVTTHHPPILPRGSEDSAGAGRRLLLRIRSGLALGRLANEARARRHRQTRIFRVARIGGRQRAQPEQRAARGFDAPGVTALAAQPRKHASRRGKMTAWDRR